MQTTVSTESRKWSEADREWMRRALELAGRGSGLVSPSPLVGCVIVDSDGHLAGEGFYVYENLKHAETLALEQAGRRARGGTAYVSLEPHAHHSRTPPCTDALINARVKRVVAAIEDPNPKVSGRGFAHLREAGIETVTGLMADEARRQNEKYIHYMLTGQPFVHLKLACSLDGKIATRTGDSRWVAGEESRARAHDLRHEYDAILVGTGTALTDNPLLTDRSGRPRRRPLVRVLLDERLQLGPNSKLALTAQEAPVLVFTSKETDESAAAKLSMRGVEVFRIDGGSRNLRAVLEELGRRSLQSILLEGGGKIAGAFVDAGFINKATF
ncbi:MAG TPA: bifunctional diaminohydroxyphosphoribosylaminopyrimidine deaminase/5-amino-6-(5-phosphoribosylamino)uracil reductase RibD, partial [Pyrinomonadaceae bacterium]|nr:bifunctional diaminohydroxyphosphoribosylaminopyrimidine deaminase/5-amino-6-(5-phosphoribosylamino)uracil reductase RibD [Pyrinomonadaceae bacterium]